jgi:hypothetical protein
MNTRATISVAVLTFVAGVTLGIGGSRTSFLAKFADKPSSTQSGPLIQSANVRGLLADLLKGSPRFILTGAEDYRGQCNVPATMSSLHDDYMAVKPSQGSEFFLPYGAIYRVDREGPGNIDLPVVHTTAFPLPKFCGD